MVPTEDEESLKEKGYSFTIKNTCNTIATYEVNLEDLLASQNVKQFPNQYIKVSLNDGTPKVLNTYEEAKTTLDTATSSFKLTSGSLKPNEEATYELKLWMDANTPAIDEVMNATFESKITVNTSYIEEENLANEITILATSQNDDYSKDKETFKIDITSASKNIIEYSYDNKKWTSVTPSKTLTLEKEYIKEGNYPIYVKDEVGNIKEYDIKTDKLDQTSPERIIEEINNQESYLLKITMTDEKSGVSSYQITESKETPTSWLDYTGIIEKEISENGVYYIWSKDNVGNISYEAYSITLIDKEAPKITVTNTLTDWGVKDILSIHLTDDVIGLSGYQVTTSEEEPTSFITIENTLDTTVTYEITENGTYYVYAKDAYNHIAYEKIVIDKIDNIPPYITSVTNSSNETWTNKDVTVSLLAGDNETNVTKYQMKYSKTNGEWQDLESNFYTFNEELNETVYFRVQDEVGNVSEEVSTDIKIDKTSPSPKISASVSGNSITVSASGSSDLGSGLATYYYSKDAGNTFVSSSSNSYTFTGLSDGTYTLVVKVSDKVGLVSSSIAASVTVKYTWVVSYNANGGAGAPESQTKYGGSTLTLSSVTPSKVGHTFLGWSTSSESSNVSYAPSSTYEINADLTLYAVWQVNSYYLDLNGYLDNVSSTGTNNYGTFDVYVNGILVADDVTDFYQLLTYGSTYEIKDIKALTGHTYNGVYAGSLTGTMPEGDTSVYLNFSTNSYYLDLNGYLDGVVSPNIEGYGTADVYVNGIQVANDVTDFYGLVAYGSTYEIKDIKCQDGIRYDGVYEGSLTGTMGADIASVSLKFNHTGTIASTFVTNLVGNGQVFADDPAGNVRYVGANPNNYVSFNNELWRIVGSFNSIGNGSGSNETRLKIIRDSSYGSYVAYGSSGYWTSSSVKDILNNTFYNSINSTSKNLIANAVWNIGQTSGYVTASQFYSYERSGSTWTGIVGLVYPSDYGYATSGGSTSRATCLSTALHKWSNASDCYNNNWLHTSANYWTMNCQNASWVNAYGGNLYLQPPTDTLLIRPVVFLKASVKITGGSGTSGSPYILGT